MSARAIVLRVLLCVALVFNGAASAMASVQMMQMHAQADDAAGSTDAHAGAMTESTMSGSTMSCHHDGQPQQRQPGDSTAAAKDTHPAAPDCCKSGTCACACVSPVVAVVPTLAFQGLSMADAGPVRPMALGHAAPALPHLIRPPIG